MKKMWALGAILVVAVALVVVANVTAADKEETLKGSLVCGKCTLQETSACSNVLQVKVGDKLVNYYIDDDGKSAVLPQGHLPRRQEGGSDRDRRRQREGRQEAHQGEQGRSQVSLDPQLGDKLEAQARETAIPRLRFGLVFFSQSECS